MIDYKDLDQLVAASAAQQVAEEAPAEIQLKAVAHAINTAANSGEYKVTFQEPLLPEVLDELKSKGYKIAYIAKADYKDIALITWRKDSE